MRDGRPWITPRPISTPACSCRSSAGAIAVLALLVLMGNTIDVSGDDDVDVRTDGVRVFRHIASGGTVTPVAMDPESGDILFVAGDRHLYRVDNLGIRRWRYHLPAAPTGELALSAGGNALIPLENGELLSVNRSGSPAWRLSGDQTAITGTAVGEMGYIFVSYGDGTVRAINESGRALWAVELSAGIDYPPVLDQEGNLIVANRQGLITVFAQDGRRLHSAEIEGAIAGILPVESAGALSVRNESEVIELHLEDAHYSGIYEHTERVDAVLVTAGGRIVIRDAEGEVFLSVDPVFEWGASESDGARSGLGRGARVFGGDLQDEGRGSERQERSDESPEIRRTKELDEAHRPAKTEGPSTAMFRRVEISSVATDAVGIAVYPQGGIIVADKRGRVARLSEMGETVWTIDTRTEGSLKKPTVDAQGGAAVGSTDWAVFSIPPLHSLVGDGEEVRDSLWLNTRGAGHLGNRAGRVGGVDTEGGDGVSDRIRTELARASSDEARKDLLDELRLPVQEGGLRGELGFVRELLVELLTADGRRGERSAAPEVRAEAAVLLGRIGDQASRGALIRQGRRETHGQVMIAIVDGLGTVGMDSDGASVETIALVFRQHDTGAMAEAVVEALAALEAQSGRWRSAAASRLLIAIMDGPYGASLRSRAREVAFGFGGDSWWNGSR